MKTLITILCLLLCTTTFSQFTKVTAPIGRNNNADTTYPTHIDSLGKGGLIAFSSTANRDALPFALRKKGMIAIVADSMIYQLVGGIANPNWVRRFFINGSSSGGGLLDSLTLNGNILCEYFTSGAVKCFTLPGGNCISHVESGSVIWDSLLVFHSTVYNYFIGCRNFTAQPTDFTLDPAYVTAPRIDVWVVDTFGIIRVVKGDSSGLKYQYDPTWELEVAFATIGANSTVPSNITNVGVYLEDVEWVFTSDAPGAVSNYTTAPYAGLLSCYVPSFTNGQFVQYTDNITYDISGISFLNYRLRLDAALSSGNINITFYNGLIAITNPVTILDGQYGFNSATVGSYQLNAIPSSAWTLNGNGTDFDAVKFTFSGTGGPLQLDNVILQIGGSGTGGGNVVTSFTGGDGSPPRIGNVILRRTDVVWNYDSTALNYDTTYYKHYNNGLFLDSTWIAKTPIVARNGITITDTTINGIAAKIFIGSGSGSGLDSSAYISITGIAYGSDSALIFCRRNGYCDTIVYTVGSTDWHVTGNLGTDTLVNKIGTLDNMALLFVMDDKRSGAVSDTTARNTSFGYEALLNAPLSHAGITDTSEGNSAFGFRVLKANTKGSYNTGVGLEVLTANTLGTQNNGVGYQSLFKNITGVSNVGIGYQSLYENLSGYENIAIGTAALRANTTGFDNTAVGHGAMQSNTTSQWNVGYGYLALTSNTNGNYNTAIGAEALRTNSTGSASTAVGLWSLYSSTAGANTAVGTQSLYATSTGSLNTAVGYHALEKNVTGSRNIAMGHDAGHLQGDSVSFSTTINDGVYLGYRTKTLVATETNAMVFGAFAQSEGNNKIVLGNPQHSNTRFFGAIRDSSYGTGAITGTGAYAIQVDATGRFIEAAISGGGGGSGISEVIATNGLSNVNDSTIQLGGTLLNPTDIDLDNNEFSFTQGSYKTLSIDPANDTMALRIIHASGAESLIKIGDDGSPPRVTIGVSDLPNGSFAEYAFGPGGVGMSANATVASQRLVSFNMSDGGIQTTYLNTTSGNSSTLLMGINTGDHPYLQLAAQGTGNTSNIIIDDTAININTPLLRINGVLYSGGGAGGTLQDAFDASIIATDNPVIDIGTNLFITGTSTFGTAIIIDPTVDAENVGLLASNITGGGNVGSISVTVSPTEAITRLTSSFNGAADEAQLTLESESGVSSITHTADTSIFNGIVKIVDGTEGAGKVLTSNALGVASWQAPTGGTVKETHTSGATITLNSTTTWIIINPASLLAALAITMPATPVDGQRVDMSFGGTLTSGTVVTALTVTPNSGQTVLQNTAPSLVEAGESISYRYNSTNSIWYRQ